MKEIHAEMTPISLYNLEHEYRHPQPSCESAPFGGVEGHTATEPARLQCIATPDCLDFRLAGTNAVDKARAKDSVRSTFHPSL